MQDRQQANQRCQNERREQQDLHKADLQVKRLPTCDGSTPQLVRDWLREVELTVPYSTRTVYIATQTARASLRWELEQFLEAQPNRDQVTWPQLKTHIQDSFLCPYEARRLRDEVKKLKQGAYETSAAYGRRFRDAADRAYPPVNGARNPDQTRILLEEYSRGLYSSTVKGRLCREGRPDSFQAAMTLVQAYEADEYAFRLSSGDSLDRIEEPMEVGAVGGTPWANDLAEVKRQVTGLASQFTKLMATIEKSNASAAAPSAKHSKSKSKSSARYNSLKCTYCDKNGHEARDCRKQQRDLNNQGNH